MLDFDKALIFFSAMSQLEKCLEIHLEYSHILLRYVDHKKTNNTAFSILFSLLQISWLSISNLANRYHLNFPLPHDKIETKRAYLQY